MALNNCIPTLKYLKLQSNEFVDDKFEWPYGLSESRIVVEEAIHHTSVFDILNNNLFPGTLNLHRTITSLIKQNPSIIHESISSFDFEMSPFYKTIKTKRAYFSKLEVSNYRADVFLTSAAAYILRDLFLREEVSPNKTMNFNFFFTEFLSEIQNYYFLLFYSKTLFKFFYKIELFSYYPVAFLDALKFSRKYICQNRLTSENFLLYKQGLVNYLTLFNFSFIISSEKFFESVLLQLLSENKSLNQDL